MSPTPGLSALLEQRIRADVHFEEKRERLVMLYVEELLLGQPDKILLMKLHYLVSKTDSDRKTRCEMLLNALLRRTKIKIKKVDMDNVRKEITLNNQIEAETSQKLLSPAHESNGAQDVKEAADPQLADLLTAEDAYDLEELYKLKDELEKLVVERLKLMGHDIKSSQIRFGQILRKDTTTIFDTQSMMVSNTSTLTDEQKRLKKVQSDSWRTTCYMLLMFIVVVVAFLGTYLTIRTFPSSSKPKITSLVMSSIDYAWSVAFPSVESAPFKFANGTNQSEL